jgi:hypothetical protein
MSIDSIAYKRPTTPVRQRPYIFFRSIYNFTLIGDAGQVNVVKIQPQGNIADGNRVTHGFKIIVNEIGISSQNILININGATIDLGVLSNPGQNMTHLTLIDTTLDPLGIDSTTYNIFNSTQFTKLNLYVVEQILQISPI